MAKIGFHYGNADELKQALMELRSRLECVLLERIDAIALAQFDFDGAKNEFQVSDTIIADRQLTNWEEGRAFGETVELRWRKTEDGRFHFCCLAIDDNLPSAIQANHSLSLNDWECRPFQFLLWGVKTEGRTDEWIEKRIPRILCYPVSVADPEQKTRVAMGAEEYVRRDIGDGLYNVEERFVRFKKLCEAPEGGLP